MQTIDPTNEVLSSLLRGELAAVEAYSHAIHKFPDSAAHGELEEMREDHLQSVDILRGIISDDGGDRYTDPGPWGEVAKKVGRVSAWFGDASTMAALQHGEEQGVSEFEEALADEHVAEEVKGALATALLPRLERHLFDLERLMASR